MLQIRDHMSRSTHSLTPQLGLAEALDRLHDSGLSGLPVLDPQQRLIGFLSEQDCIEPAHRQLSLRYPHPGRGSDEPDTALGQPG